MQLFYKIMNGADWERIVDADTQAIIAHAKYIGKFFHKPLSELKQDVLFVGSREDPFFPVGYYESLFEKMLQQVKHGRYHLFDHGGHPAMISNLVEFIEISKHFLCSNNSQAQQRT